MRPISGTAEASAPASSANLGPGFDILALALELRCRVRAEPAKSWDVAHDGDHCPEGQADDAVVAGACRAVGADRPLRLTVDNCIPIGRGLGSSAAAIAAGVAAALAVDGEPVQPDRVFELTAELEGHPDNAAAAVYGGLMLCAPGNRPQRLPIHPRLRPVVAIPEEVFLTSDARQVVAPTQTTELAVRSLGRVAALVAGFLTADPSLLASARGDEIHEGPRARIRPETAELIDIARSAGAHHAAWSGSGPAMIAIVESDSEAAVVKALSGAPVRVMSLDVATAGLEMGPVGYTS